MKKATVLVVLAGLALMIPAAGQAASVRENYTAGPAGDVVNDCDYESLTGDNVAAACFRVSAGNYLTINVHDDAFANVGFFYEFRNAAGDCLGASDDLTEPCPNSGFGVSKATLKVPTGAVEFKVYMNGPVFSGPDLAAGEVDGVATTGYVLGTQTTV